MAWVAVSDYLSRAVAQVMREADAGNLVFCQIFPSLWPSVEIEQLNFSNITAVVIITKSSLPPLNISWFCHYPYSYYQQIIIIIIIVTFHFLTIQGKVGAQPVVILLKTFASGTVRRMFSLHHLDRWHPCLDCIALHLLLGLQTYLFPLGFNQSINQSLGAYARRGRRLVHPTKPNTGVPSGKSPCGFPSHTKYLPAGSIVLMNPRTTWESPSPLPDWIVYDVDNQMSWISHGVTCHVPE